MDTEGHWAPFHVNREGLPNLLVKCSIGEAGYTISITDLLNIWSETLSTAQILATADEQGCSINPVDDRTQLPILLEKIRDVLQHQDGTSVRMRVQGSDDLSLALYSPLPIPLPPFKWTMTLFKASAAQLATEVVSPLILLAHEQQQQIKFLLGQLRDKDHVMSRLLDRMESTNTDLGAVFPGVSGASRNSQRSLKRRQVAKHVRGLAPFEPGSELQHSGEAPSTDALYRVLRDASGVKGEHLLEPSQDAWWRHVAQHEVKLIASFGVAADLDGDETESDLDFQTQTIPDHLQRQRPANISSPSRPLRAPSASNLAPSDDNTTLEDHMTSSPPPVPLDLFRLETEIPAPDSPSKRLNTQVKRISTIGGRESSQAQRSSSPAKPPERSGSVRVRVAVSPTPPPTQPPSAQPTPSKMRRIGAIGRRGSPQLPQFQVQPSQALPALEEEETQYPRLGPRGLHSNLAAQVDRADVRQTRAARGKASEDPPPRETSVERANRIRDELRRNLEAQPKPSVAKRKRRF